MATIGKSKKKKHVKSTAPKKHQKTLKPTRTKADKKHKKIKKDKSSDGTEKDVKPIAVVADVSQLTKNQTPVQDTSDTIFIRNLSFDTDESDLKRFIEENFGETVYCLVCKCKESGESKGTAFAKFKDSSHAKKCLEEFKDRELQVKFHLDGRNLIVLPALTKNEAQEVKTTVREKKDKRNLALAKVGSFGPHSDEVQEMSSGDVEKRKALHLRKREKLKNLHNFVSDVRLCVHNLPPSLDDIGLKKIFSKAIQDDAPTAKIVECRVMRNKRGGGKLGTSKCFAFVAFSKHEHALLALEKINNNPSIFSKDKRPIVEFSIENLVALNKKKTRLVNSKRKLQALATTDQQTAKVKNK